MFRAFAENGTSWITNYVGMGLDGDLMINGDCITQYMLSIYWILGTWVTSSLIDGMWPTNWWEVHSCCLNLCISRLLSLFAG